MGGAVLLEVSEGEAEAMLGGGCGAALGEREDCTGLGAVVGVATPARECQRMAWTARREVLQRKGGGAGRRGEGRERGGGSGEWRGGGRRGGGGGVGERETGSRSKQICKSCLLLLPVSQSGHLTF